MTALPNTLTVRPGRTRPGLTRRDIIAIPAAILACALCWKSEVRAS